MWQLGWVKVGTSVDRWEMDQGPRYDGIRREGKPGVQWWKGGGRGDDDVKLKT